MTTEFHPEPAPGHAAHGFPVASRWPPFPWNPRGLDNPLIGRGDARAELNRAVDDVIAHWAVRLQLVVSDGGLGKSRLLRAVIDDARGRHPELRTHHLRCAAVSGGGGNFRLWDGLVRNLFGISSQSDPASAGAELARALARHVIPEDAEYAASTLLGTVPRGIARDDSADIARCTTILGRVLEGMAFDKPLLIIVDDAHRGSPKDFALAASLAATTKGRPVLLVFAGSPRLTDHLPGWERLPVIRLPALSPAESERMFRLYLTGLETAPSRTLLERLIRTGGGNSFAIKSLVRWLYESRGIEEAEGRWTLDETRVLRLQIPDTLEGVIHARLLALPADERETLAQAASIGREFWAGTLVAIARNAAGVEMAEEVDFLGGPWYARVRAHLTKFVEQRILEVRQSRLRGEECFGFRTAAHHQVALEELPSTTRRVYHRVILAWLERQSEALLAAGENDSALLRELARHAEAAGKEATAAVWHHRAASHAVIEGYPRAALASLERALATVEPEQLSLRLQIATDLADVHQRLGTTGLALEHAEEALRLAWKLADRRAAAKVLGQLAELEAARGEHKLARTYLVQALRIHEVLQDARGIAAGSLQLGRWYWQLGDFDKALLCYRKARGIYDQLGDTAGSAEVMHALGAVHYDRGDIVDAQSAYEGALRLRRAAGDSRGVARTLNNLGAVWMSRRLERSVQLWEEAFDIARGNGDVVMQASLANNLGEVLVLLGREEEAGQKLQRAVELAELTGNRAVLVDALRNQGVMAREAGEFERARALFRRAAEEAARLGVLRLQGLVARALGDLELALVDETGVIEGIDGGGSIAEAEAHFVAAAHDFEAGRYDLEAAETWERIEKVLSLGGRSAEARAAGDRATVLRQAHASANEPPPLPAT